MQEKDKEPTPEQKLKEPTPTPEQLDELDELEFLKHQEELEKKLEEACFNYYIGSGNGHMSLIDSWFKRDNTLLLAFEYCETPKI